MTALYGSSNLPSPVRISMSEEKFYEDLIEFLKEHSIKELMQLVMKAIDSTGAK